ncbi:PAS domain-containing protein, partial [Pyxidicoccus sp. 3LFB2]
MADEQRETGHGDAQGTVPDEPSSDGSDTLASPHPMVSPATSAVDAQRARILDELMREVVFHLDARGHLVMLGRPWERLTGMLVERWLGRSLVEAFHPEDRERARALLESVALQRSLAPREELRLAT